MKKLKSKSIKYRLGLMNITEKFRDETIRAIGCLIRYKYNSLITVKKIRDLYHIEPFDNSKINFYWRSLQYLEKGGVLKRYSSKKPKEYRVSNFFKFFQILHDAYINLAMIDKNNG
ncbi:MAG: hypothetical protein ACFE9Q_15690 [Candidatus Hodarchaeota archaeon]